jgi:hypothetical protein
MDEKTGNADSKDLFQSSLNTYKIGDCLTDTNETIKQILGQSARASVFMLDSGRVYWEFHMDTPIPERVIKAKIICEEMINIVCISVFDRWQNKLLKQIVAAMLSFLDADSELPAKQYFAVVEKSIFCQVRAQQSMYYILGAHISVVLGAAIGGLLLYIFPHDIENTKYVYWGACAGGVGAIISVFQRISNLDLDLHSPCWYSIFQGFIRGGLGVFFGTFFILVNRANLVLGSLSDNIFAILTFSGLAGISERFIPEIIKKLENSSKES